MGMDFCCADATARDAVAASELARKLRRFMIFETVSRNDTLESVLPEFPADLLIPDVLASLRSGRNVIVEAAPGAGKTTRIPPALLALGGEVVVLEPRRIAARMAARRVAEEMG